MLPPMPLSTIAKQTAAGPGSPFARALGREIRRLRLARGLSQAELGTPLTRSLVSSIEAGRTVPSLATLVLLTDHLDVTMESVFGSVNRALTQVYTSAH